MSNDTTLRNHLAARRSPARAPTRVRRAARVSPSEAVARTWFAANLLAVAGVGSALGGTTTPAMLTAWVGFTLLNAALFLAIRSGWLIAPARAIGPGLNASLAALMGCAWGSGLLLLLPSVDAIGVAVLLAAAFAVALTGLPAFAAYRGAYAYLVFTLGALAIVAVVRDARFPLAALWTAFGGAGLLIIGKAYADNQSRLRTILAELLLGDGAGARFTANPDDDALATLARERLAQVDATLARHQRIRQVLRGLGEAILVTDAKGVVEYANPAAEALLGFSRRDLVGHPLEQRLRIVFPPADRNHAREIFEQLRRSRRKQHGNDSARMLRRDGSVLGIDYVACALADSQGAFTGIVFTLRDVTEQRNRAEGIAWQATHDPLTGSINRGEFEVRLKKLVRRAQDDQAHTHALLYIDVDKFKFVNDSYGHAAGDAALKELSDLLRTRIRGADTLARIGGDEFAALLYSCELDRARLIAEGLRIAVDHHRFRFEGIELPLSLSIGVVEINRACRGSAELMRTADTACYAAKRYGRNRVHVHRPDAPADTPRARTFDFVKDIQSAIQGNRLELFVQPLVALGDDAVQSRRCELFVGIRDQHGELMPRAALHELADRYQLVEDIDRWVVRAALDALRLEHPALRDMALVLIPLCQQSLGDERLLAHLSTLVAEYPAQAGRLAFCFDAAGVTAHYDSVRGFVRGLRQHGCRIMLSDFGVGGEAVALMKSLEAEMVGIRSALTEAVPGSSVDHEVVAGLVRIARKLGIQTVADGAADPARLRTLGIDFARGASAAPPQAVSIPSDAQWI